MNATSVRSRSAMTWVNPFRWSAGTNYDSDIDRKWKDQGWLLSYGKYTVFNPGIEEVREHIVNICREIVTGYAVDGLVFDDYFTPNRIPETSDAPDYALWQEQSPWMSFGDWRRANVHKTVADIHCMLLDTRPDVRFGISPAGVAGSRIHLPINGECCRVGLRLTIGNIKKSIQTLSAGFTSRL